MSEVHVHVERPSRTVAGGWDYVVPPTTGFDPWVVGLETSAAHRWWHRSYVDVAEWVFGLPLDENIPSDLSARTYTEIWNHQDRILLARRTTAEELDPKGVPGLNFVPWRLMLGAMLLYVPDARVIVWAYER